MLTCDYAMATVMANVLQSDRKSCISNNRWSKNKKIYKKNECEETS